MSADTIVARPAIPGFAGTCAHPLHLLVSSYVRLAYAEMRLAIEDEGTVHTRTGSQARRSQEYLGQVNFSNLSN